MYHHRNTKINLNDEMMKKTHGCKYQQCQQEVKKTIVSPKAKFVKREPMQPDLLLSDRQIKVQISCVDTSEHLFRYIDSYIVHSLYLLKLTFQASSHILWLYSPVCIGSGRNPRTQTFSIIQIQIITLCRTDTITFKE